MTGRDLLVRPPAVAGMFYPGTRDSLERSLDEAFDDAVPPDEGAPLPKAIVVPHAGYIYSGPVAASAYLRVAPLRLQVRKVVLLGPSHRVPVRGLAVPTVDAFSTPLGLVPIDDQLRDAALRAGPFVVADDVPHANEHSLEVQLPFLQRRLDDFTLLPLAVGHASAGEVASVIDTLWGGSETLVVVSTDLSHYERYEVARARDERTAAAVVAMTPEAIGDMDACGAYALRGLLVAAARHHLAVERLDVRSSGDTAGDHSRVVGYGAFAVA